MSHSVKVVLIAGQEINLLGNLINIHDLKTIYLNSDGQITDYILFSDSSVENIERDIDLKVAQFYSRLYDAFSKDEE